MCASSAHNGIPKALPLPRRQGHPRRIPLSSNLPLDLPITPNEIHMVFEELGSEVAALFDGDH